MCEVFAWELPNVIMDEDTDVNIYPKEVKGLADSSDPLNLVYSSETDTGLVPSNGNFFAGTCVAISNRTSGKPNDVPYWYVELDKEAFINEVNVFNRWDCCSDRLVPY